MSTGRLITAFAFCLVGQVASADTIGLGRSDGMGLGCDEQSDLSVLSDAIAAENFEVILDLVESKRVCVAIWGGSTGELIERSEDGSTALVRVTHFAEMLDWPERELWVEAGTIN